MSDLDISVIGTGAVGGFYGGLLCRRGYRVHFLLNSDFSQAAAQGLKIDSKWGNFRLPRIQAYPSLEALPRADLLLVCLKTGKNSEFFPRLPKKLKKGGRVVLMQNGLGMEEALASFLPAGDIMGATCFICSQKVAPAHIEHLDYGSLKIGEYGPPAPESPCTLAKVVDIFLSSGIPTTPMENLSEERWKKLLWNIPFNGLSVVMNCPTDQILSRADARKRVKMLMTEVRKMAGACGFNISSEFAEQMFLNTQKMVAYMPSMLWDYRKNNPLELEALYQEPIWRSQNAGYFPVEVEKLYEELRNKVNWQL